MSLSTSSYLDRLTQDLDKASTISPETQELAYQIFLSIDRQWRATHPSAATSLGILHPTLCQKYKETDAGFEEPPEHLLNQLLFQISDPNHSGLKCSPRQGLSR